MLLRIEHETTLTYSEPVFETVIEARMVLPSNEDQTVLGYRLRTSPPATMMTYRDGFGNGVEMFNIYGPVQRLMMRASSYVRLHRDGGRARLEADPINSEPTDHIDVLEFLRPSPLVSPGPAVDAFLATISKPTDGSLAYAADTLMEGLHNYMSYEKKVTTSRTPVAEALELRRGVCQDFTHAFLVAARTWRIPARYVSGYINQTGEIATHAWCQVWGPSAGWVDIDPTQKRWIENEHVVVAIGRDFSDVPPNRGVWKGNAEETIAVTVHVQEANHLPPDFMDLTHSAWTSTAAAPESVRQQRINQQRRAHLYRQQQSQQQQG